MVLALRIKTLIPSILLLNFLPACQEKVVQLSSVYRQSSERRVLSKSPAAYDGHLCYITPANELFCLGNNQHGQLGIGSEDKWVDTFQPVAVPAGTAAKAGWFSVATGLYHTCGLLTDGSLWCWGSNRSSQLGQKNFSFEDHSSKPQPVPGKWQAVAVGATYSCGITIESRLKCFGTAPGGGWQLLDGQKALILTEPRSISAAANWRGLSSSSGHVCALNNLGELWCFGENGSGRLGLEFINSGEPRQFGRNSQYRLVAANEDSTCTVTRDGHLSCLGDNANLAKYLPHFTSRNLQDIAVGSHSLCAVDNEGALICAGNNEFSQLGVDTPFGKGLLNQLDGQFVAALPLEHTNCGLKKDGSIWCAGYSDKISDLLKKQERLLLKKVPHPQMTLGHGYTTVAAGENHTCAIRWDHTVWCVGNNSRGQCGRPLTENVILTPQPVDGLSMAMELSCGADHCCALNEQNEVYCFGDNKLGQFSPNEVGKALPVPHKLSKKFKTITAGYAHTCGIDIDNNAVCYGNGRDFGAASSSYGPFRLNGGPWSSVVMGEKNFCFINKYQLACMGDNHYGQLFETGISGRKSPNPLKMAAVKEVAIAGDAIFAIKKDNSLACWGSAKLCGPAAAQKENTVRQWPINGKVAFAKIVAAESADGQPSGHLCGLTTDNALACLGHGESGQLGDGQLKPGYFAGEPQLLDSDTSFKEVAVGGRHTCALSGSGDLYCFGDNSFYQLGLPLPGNAAMRQLWPVIDSPEETN